VKPIERVADAAMAHSKVVILVMLLVSAAVGAGAAQVEQDSSLDQFESDTDEAKAQTFIGENFDPNPNGTTVQIIVRNESGNVLTKSSYLQSLEYQQRLQDDGEINATLADENPTVGVANVVARTAIVQNRSAQLRARGAELERRNRSLQEDGQELQRRSDVLNDTAENVTVGLVKLQELQKQYDQLNESHDAGRMSDERYAQASAAIEREMAQTRANVTVELDALEEEDFDASLDRGDEFNASGDRIVGLQSEYHQLNESLEEGRISQAEYDERAARIRENITAIRQNAARRILAQDYTQLAEEGEDLENRSDQLQADAEAFQADLEAFRENPPNPTIEEQIEYVESMSQEDVRNVTTTVLSGEGGPGSDRALQLMPKSYEPGSDTASARMLFITQEQRTGVGGNSPQAFSEEIVDAQLQMRTLTEDASNSEEYVVFGFGVINEEIDQSMSDSMIIVGPLALLFVLVTLLIAYRDLLDIVLGVFGIGLVLLWTWGFMGWTGIKFNQIMIAVPVLLIGLSIDYAIHIFMRHREARTDANGADTPRGSMKLALAGVGIALLWVTATTVIGFMSNLISPLGPIQDFGVASSAGITATLLIFGLLIPALKVEIDGFLESRFGLDRTKRAFGTGGGRLGNLLSVGYDGARRAPVAVILVALLLTGAGAVGATQVDTQFEQSDFLAEEPPDVLYDLPEPFKPGEYSAKKNLDYVYDNFQSPDQQADILINSTDGNEGSVATADTLQRLDAAEEDLQSQDRYDDSVFIGATDEANVQSPLTVMQRVAQQNASFNESFRQADDDGDGVPDENVTALYDELFAVAPDQATQVIYRDGDGEYTAVRMRIAVKGTATSATVTEDMRHLAGERFDDGSAGLTAVATGDPIINEIVQNQLLDTVIESLLVTLVAVFAFLMIVYRITEGSATLGAVTLLPVALSVAWILGTMFLLGIPFNAVTGTITSLTIGLGVAYSIHLSERFNLEMDRQDEAVWPAMYRSVTGTGGALMGSAATTAGGFGVLAFALLPALQQFGIITGITIVYAFLASVFVLPSLLAIWTRYVGPDEADFDADPTFDDPDDDLPDYEDDTGHESVGASDVGVPSSEDDDPLAARSDEDTPVPTPVSDDAEQTEATGDETEPATEEPSALTGGTVDDEETDLAGVATPDERSPPAVDAERSVAPGDPEPGEELTVSVVVRDVSGRVVLTENVPGSGGSITSFDPEPLVKTRDGRTVYVVWDLPAETDLGVTYTTAVPDDAPGGESLSFQGTVETPDGETPIDGDGVSVVTPFLADLRESGTVTDADLETAGRLARDGDLTGEAFGSIYRRWLGATPAPTTETDAAAVGDGGTDEAADGIDDTVFDDADDGGTR